jgi:hypothetical protein
MTNFRPIVDDAYQDVLGRNADPGGLTFYNRRMNEGLSEADVRETLLRSPEYAARNPGFRPLVIDGRFNFDYYGYTSFGLFGRSLDERKAWIERGVEEGITVFRVFSDTSFWPPDPLLDQVPKHRAVDASGLHPSSFHVDTVTETVLEAIAPLGAILEYVILVTQFEANGPLFRRFPETESYVFEVLEAFHGLPNVLFELGNEVDIHGKGWGVPRADRVMRQVRERWPFVAISCSSGRPPDPVYGAYVYESASWGNIHYPRSGFPELDFGWPTFHAPIVDDEPEFYPTTSIEDYVRHFELVREQSGFMTVHSETGFVTDPEDDADIPLLRALQQARFSSRLRARTGR